MNSFATVVILLLAVVGLSQQKALIYRQIQLNNNNHHKQDSRLDTNLIMNHRPTAITTNQLLDPPDRNSNDLLRNEIAPTSSSPRVYSRLKSYFDSISSPKLRFGSSSQEIINEILIPANNTGTINVYTWERLSRIINNDEKY